MLKTLTNITLQGGRLALKMKKQPLSKIRKNEKAWDIVTQADQDVQQLITTLLNKYFPDIELVAEEQDTHNIPSGNFFTIDPIDGTIPFSHGYNNWGVIIGHIVSGQPVHGVIYLPERDIVITAQKGKGCTLNTKRIVLNNSQLLSESVVSIEMGPWTPEQYWSGISLLRKSCRWLGGSGMVASSIADILLGRSVAYTNFTAKIWDYSASALAIAEAGGTAVQYDGKDLSWNRIKMSALFAANKNIANEILNIINS